jgi:hypothetical protein
MAKKKGWPQKRAEKGGFLYGVIIIVLILLFGQISLAAQEREQGDYLNIKVVEIGPGDEFFSWWGHLAVIVENELTGKSLCYDFGVFSFDDPYMVRNFLKGDLNYQIIVSDAYHDIEWYIQDNRDITYYTLNLDSWQKEQINNALNWSVLPENHNYFYKIFTDNCVTRVILIIDDVLNGEFIGRYKNEKGSFTLRGHAGRHLYRSPILYVLLNFLMGEAIDKSASKYEEMYLPSEFTKALVDFTYTDKNGNIQPLVSDIEKISTAIGRPVVLSKPPNSWLFAFLAGIAGAMVFILLMVFRKKNKVLHVAFYITQSLMALCWGFVGTVLFYAMFFSNHVYTYNNLNIIFANPLLFIGVPLGILCAVTKQERKYVLYSKIQIALWTYVLIGSIISIVIKVAGANCTDNSTTLLLLVPSSIVLSYFGDLMVKKMLPEQ